MKQLITINSVICARISLKTISSMKKHSSNINNYLFKIYNKEDRLHIVQKDRHGIKGKDIIQSTVVIKLRLWCFNLLKVSLIQITLLIVSLKLKLFTIFKLFLPSIKMPILLKATLMCNYKNMLSLLF